MYLDMTSSITGVWISLDEGCTGEERDGNVDGE